MRVVQEDRRPAVRHRRHADAVALMRRVAAQRRDKIAVRDLADRGGRRRGRDIVAARIIGVGHHHGQRLAFIRLGRRVGQGRRPGADGVDAVDLPLVAQMRVAHGDRRPAVHHRRHTDAGALMRRVAAQRRDQIAAGDLADGAKIDRGALAARRIRGISCHKLE